MPLYLYEPPLRAVVRQLKFGGLSYLGHHIAHLLAAEERPALERADRIVPVPLHWRRRLRRGYNQAEEIARPLGRHLGRPVTCSLIRVRSTRPQASLDRASRLVNLDGAFAPGRRADLAARRILLVDDVVTTGRTLTAAAAELKRAGAEQVIAAVLARAVPDDPPAPGWQGS